MTLSNALPVKHSSKSTPVLWNSAKDFERFQRSERYGIPRRIVRNRFGYLEVTLGGCPCCYQGSFCEI